MGGGYYDRDVFSAVDDTRGYSSTAAKIVGTTNSLSKAMDPRRFDEKTLQCNRQDPIVFALDVTGSMGDWSKIIYDKMPMFYGQIKEKNYLEDPSISFCGIGDATCDEAPLQVSDFAEGTSIDSQLKSLYLEGGGGGGFCESYELAAFFYLKNCELLGHEYPFFFITGDETYYEKLKTKYINKVLGTFQKEDLDARGIFHELKRKFNVFLIKKPYDSPNEVKVRKLWIEALGEERVLDIQNAKACIDVILGAIAITTGKRRLNEYIADMKERGQVKNRCDEVAASLERYAIMYEKKQVQIVKLKVNPGDKYFKEVVKGGDIDFRNIIEVADKLIVEDLSEENLKYLNALRSLKKAFKDTVPPEFFCPITTEIFFDPVMTADGQTYEKAAITEWLKTKDTSPLTGKILSNKRLLPNFVMKKLINSFYEMNKKDL